MNYDEYAALEGVNWSRLKLARKSLLHFRDEPKRPDTASLGMLRAVHALVLEPEHFAEDFTVYDGRRDKRTAKYQAFLETVGSRTVLSTKEHAEASRISQAVAAYKPAADLLSMDGACAEVPLHWTDRATGLTCKGRADLVITDGKRATLIDLKTCRTIDGRGLASDAARMGYHGQLAHYAAGVESCMGGEVVAWALLCVEGTAPHDVGLYYLDDEAKRAGSALRNDLLAQVADAQREDHYPGQCMDPGMLTLPAWAVNAAHDFDDTFTGGGSDA